MKSSLRRSIYCFTLLLGASLAKAVVVTVAPPIPSNVPSYTNHQQFQSAILNSTNTYRAEYNASAVSWNTTLANFAAHYLETSNCVFAHSGGPYGENLAEGYANATASVEAWGNEAAKYNFNNPGFSETTGHFTQLVWQNTTDTGCACRLCGRKGWYVVCEYWPRGNVIGAFNTEVQGPVGAGSTSPPRIWSVLFVALACYLVSCKE
jgi:uncharacterized protein YkwD